MTSLIERERKSECDGVLGQVEQRMTWPSLYGQNSEIEDSK